MCFAHAETRVGGATSPPTPLYHAGSCCAGLIASVARQLPRTDEARVTFLTLRRVPTWSGDVVVATRPPSGIEQYRSSGAVVVYGRRVNDAVSLL